MHLKVVFLFNNTLTEKSDGISMGNPLKSVMANIYMIYFESLLQDKSNLIRMKYWFRHVNNDFAIFDDKLDLTTIL